MTAGKIIRLRKEARTEAVREQNYNWLLDGIGALGARPLKFVVFLQTGIYCFGTRAGAAAQPRRSRGEVQHASPSF
jgi:hypothetical protein